VGIVAIGRNEGERLRACLTSALAQSPAVVYVDSGSTDNSVALAASLGATVVNLDLATPFTAARARNEGFAKLLAAYPAIEQVFFVDGDCEIVATFMPRAIAELSARAEVAVVCGRRRERHPGASAYNRLCDIEWNTPVGEASACGGDALMRVSSFKSVAGFNESVIAGEEPELCVRLRSKGMKILRIDEDMTLHDAAITKFSQWWRRNLRAGHAFAQGAAMHGAPPQRHWVKEVRSNDVWGLLVPLMSIGLAVVTSGIGLLLWPVAWGVLGLKVYRSARKRLGADTGLYSFFIVIGKVPQALGQLKYRLSRLLGRQNQIIEYKTAAAGSS